MARSSTSFIFLCFLCLAFANTQAVKDKDILDIDDTDAAFEEFKNKFEKSYSNKDQATMRKSNFQKNLIALKNLKCDSCHITAYFDRDEKELEKMRGLKIQNLPDDENVVQLSTPSNQGQGNTLRKENEKDGKNTGVQGTISASTQTTVSLGTYLATLDWRAKGTVTPVRDQGNCGSCWAFATVAFFESEVARTKGISATSLDLAEQFLLKCDLTSGGCNGGNCVSASSLTISKGLPLESTYAYNPTKKYTNICKAQSSAYTFTGAKLTYFSGNRLTDDQIIGLLQTRPLMIYVTATYWYMYSFSANRTFSCRASESDSSSTLNHAVLLVGYTDTEWIVKNSWGTGFGDAGYIYVSRTQGANCGMGFFVATLA